MAGDHHHGFADEAESLLLHYTGGHTEGLARADGVRDIGLACADDPPNNTPLVGPQGDDIAGAGQLQMASVGSSGRRGRDRSRPNAQRRS